MGMYTSIIHPVGNREIQIKTGDDSCDTYKLGDTVPFEIDQYSPQSGTLLDGAYDGHSSELSADGHERIFYPPEGLIEWVIIKNHKIHAILLLPVGLGQRDVEALFGIKDLPREMWCAAAYKLAAYREVASQTRFNAWRKEHPDGNVLLYPLSQPLFDQEPDPVEMELMREVDGSSKGSLVFFQKPIA